MIVSTFKNGNASGTIGHTGTRTIAWQDGEELDLEYPLNVDIRVSTECPLGSKNGTPGKICPFCHESALNEPDFNIEKNVKSFEDVVLQQIPESVEIAVGINSILTSFELFNVLNKYDHVVNATVNSLLLNKMSRPQEFFKAANIRGIGVSYRKDVWAKAVDSNSVLHVIAGVDDFYSIMHRPTGFTKVLVLGEKDFGFNKNNVNLQSSSHIRWRRQIHTLFEKFKVVSFDNLAVEQLRLKDRLSKDSWNTFYQGEHSFYIDIPNQSYRPSSRSSEKVSWHDISFKDYWNKIKHLKKD